MDDLQFIKELDSRLELVQNAWADELVMLSNSQKYQQGTLAYNRKKTKIDKKFVPILSMIINERNAAFERENLRQQKDLQNQFATNDNQAQTITDSHGRPKGKYWKDGKWQDYKKKEL